MLGPFLARLGNPPARGGCALATRLKRITRIFGTGDSNICYFENNKLMFVHMLCRFFVELVEFELLIEPVELMDVIARFVLLF